MKTTSRLASALIMGLLAPSVASAAFKGDVNLDNKVDAGDIVALSRFVSGEVTTLSATALAAADIGPLVNGKGAPDGRVDVADLVVLTRLVSREIGPAPPHLDPLPTLAANQALTLAGTSDPGTTVHLIINGETRELNTATLPFAFSNIGLTAGPNKIWVVATRDGLTSGPSEVWKKDFTDAAGTLSGGVRNAVSLALNTTAVWTPGNSPDHQGAFVVTGSLIVPSGSTLILAPGTELKFKTGATLTVNGRLLVQGAENHLVKFTSESSTARGAWTGIAISGGGPTSEIRYATIEYAQAGVSINACTVGGTNLIVRRSLIREFLNYGVTAAGGCTPTVLRTTIVNAPPTRNGTGISVHTTGSAPWIELNDISGTTIGLYAHYSAPTVKGNAIHDNNTGIMLSGRPSSAVINGGNTITANGVGIETVDLDDALGQASPSINQNSIWNNPSSVSPINFRAGDEYNGFQGSINARENWWGTTAAEAIAAGIVDGNDPQQSGRPVVDFSAFLDSQGGIPFQTLLIGDLTTSRTLDPAIAYQVVGTYRVTAGRTLTVPAGTVLAFQSGAKLRVEGTLAVNGTAASPASFTGGSTTLTPGSWSGIEIAGSSASASIGHAVIDYASIGIRIENAGAVTIANSQIKRFQLTGISMQSSPPGTGGPWLLDGNTIDRVLARDPNVLEIGIDIIDASPSVTANVIHNADIGIRVVGNSQPRLGDLGPPLVPGNEISGNDYGLWLEGRDVAGQDPRPIVNRNDFHGNATKNLVTTKFSPGFAMVIDARQNWWGTSDPTAIRATLRYDLNEPIALDIAEFLNGPGGSPAPGSLPAMSALLIGVAPHDGDRLFAPTLGEKARIDFATTATADVTLEIFTEKVFDPVGPQPAVPTIPQVLIATQSKTGVTGAGYFEWDGRNQSGAYVPEEAYTYVLTATSGGTTARFDPGLNPNDGHPVGNAANSFNVYQNQPLAFDVTLTQGSWEADPYPARVTVAAGAPQGSSPFTPVVLAQSRPVASGIPESFVFNGRRADGVLLTKSDGSRYTSLIYVETRDRRVMRPNFLIVQREKPTVRGVFAPNTAVQSTPYLVTHSYDQVTRFAFQLDQSAYVEVKMLKAGYGNPDDPNAVLAVLPITGSPAQPLAADTTYNVEWRGYDFNAPAANADGDLTFVIRATSAVDPAFQTLYRGVVQVRR